ncbi:hypothetical protein ACFQU2_29155 [Siccirubricoccus deserti]
MGSIQRPDATLEDRWEKAGETLLLTGIQALVRLPLVRHQLDQALGWNTAGYISGYRGSPSAPMTFSCRSRRSGWRRPMSSSARR